MPPSKKGQPRFTTDEWRAAVRAELKERGWSQTELAKELGTSKENVSRMLTGAHASSPWVDATTAALGVVPPQYLDARDYEVIENMRELRKVWASEHDRIAALVSQALSRQRAKERK